jgi:hypothetical protein
MSDLIDRTATGVRYDTLSRRRTVHRLAGTSVRYGGRQYKTGCHRYLYADEGAILTTRIVTCAECYAAESGARRAVAHA